MRRNPWLFVVALFWGACAHAAVGEAEHISRVKAGGPHAEPAARSLGEMESARGLQAVIAARNYDLLFEYHAGFPDGYSPIAEFPYLDEQLPPELEQVAIAALKDTSLTDKLVGGVLWIVGERRYQSRELFDLMLARPRLSQTITHTDLAGVEAPLTQRFPGMKDDEKYFIAKFLGERRYAPAGPAIEAWAAAYAYPSAGYEAIGALGAPGAGKFLVEQISRFRKPELSEPEVRTLASLVRSIDALPLDVPVDVDRMIALMPASKKHNDVAQPYIALLGKRPSKGGFDELLTFVDPYLWHKAQDALNTMFDTPESWPVVRGRLKQALDEKKISQERFDSADQRFAMRIRVQDRNETRKPSAARLAANAEEHELERKYGRKLRELQERDPGKHSLALARYQEMRNALIVKSAEMLPERFGELASQHEKAAHKLRFVDRKPAEAAREMLQARELYQKAGRRDCECALWLADLYRFDLNDPKAALKMYQAALAELPEPGEKDEWARANRMALRGWLGHEIRFLTSGERFSAPLGKDEVAAMVDYMLISELRIGFESVDRKRTGGWGFARSPDDLVKLDEFPKGQLGLIAASMALRAEADAGRVLQFVESRDPTGYLGAVLFAAANYRQGGGVVSRRDGMLAEKEGLHQKGMIEASRRYEKKHGTKFATQTDQAVVSPDGTWALLQKALRQGDRELLLSCFTASAAKGAASLAAKVPKENWGAYGMSLLGIYLASESGTKRIYDVARTRRGAPIQVTFESGADGWKISDTGVLAPMAEEGTR